jgi:membrane protein DedA with SNARE-associated domain
MNFDLAAIAFNLISQLGYGGLAFGLFIDSFGIPIPSEILIPLATALAIEGRFHLWIIFAIGTLAQVLGGTAGYLIGRYGGEPILERYGKYVLITQRDLKRVHRSFERYGNWLTLLGRCVPGVRGLIAYPAGIAEMRFSTFLIFTTIGSAAWTALWMYLGSLIGEHREIINQLAHQFSVVGLLLVAGLLLWHFRHLWRPGSKKTDQVDS